MRTHLDVMGDALSGGADGVGEANGIAHMLPPIAAMADKRKSATLPDRLEIRVIRGSANTTSETSRSNVSSTGFISGEWNACDTFSDLMRAPPAAKFLATASTAERSPLITVFAGPLMAAIATWPENGSTAARTAASYAPITVIAPSRGSACTSRPRVPTMRAASASDNAPATQAAAYSPKLWPIAAIGSNPQERHRRASAYFDGVYGGLCVRRFDPATPPRPARKSRSGWAAREAGSRSRTHRKPARNVGASFVQALGPYPRTGLPGPGKKMRRVATLAAARPVRRGCRLPCRLAFERRRHVGRGGADDAGAMCELRAPRIGR